MSFKTYIWFVLISYLDYSIGENRQSQKAKPIPTDILLCRHCGYNVAPASLVINVKSPMAESSDNHTLFGLNNIYVQTLKNPHGMEFSTINTNGGTCLGYSSHWHLEDSWYPGYAWKACKCYRCQTHLGWVYEPLSTATKDRVYASAKGFYVLNLDTIISEAYADSLIATPKLL